MHLKRLETFHFLSRYGTLLRVANRLGVTPAAISLQLSMLEQELGAKLFHHYPNKLVLTEKGKLLANKLNPIFSSLEDVVMFASQEQVNLADKLSISLGNDISKVCIPKLAPLLKRHPAVRITLLLRPSHETLSLVRNGEVDIGIGRFPTRLKGLKRTKLFDDKIFLVSPVNHPLGRLDRIRLDDLLPHRFFMLTRNSATRRIIDAFLLRNGIHLEHVIEVSNCQAGIDFVRLGVGAALVHQICLSPNRSEKRMRFVDMSNFFGKVEISLIYRSISQFTPSHHELIETLTQHAAGVKPL